MVCESCITKLGKIIVPDKWKDGSRNNLAASISSSSSSSGGGSIKAGKTNKALAAKKLNTQWLPKEHHCKICKSKTQLNMNYCNDCAHKKGICSMCGKKVIDVSSHKMSLV